VDNTEGSCYYRRMESIPKENDFEKIKEDWDAALERMLQEEAEQKITHESVSDVMHITSSGSTEDVEKYLSGNYEALSQAQKDFLLTSFRSKNFGMDLKK
jgi:hypothetical protein